MGIDISKTTDEQLLNVLGNGDWVLTLSEGYPDVIVSEAMRQALYDKVAGTFVRWVLKGVEVVIDHSSDPPWDCSGTAYRYQRDPLLLLTKYHTLEDWLTNAYTGNSQASFVSGCGLFWETYADAFVWEIGNLWSMLLNHMAQSQGIDEDDVIDYMETVWDDIYEVDLNVQEALRQYIGIGSTKAVWHKYRPIVEMQIDQEERALVERRMRRKAMQALAQQFFIQHFSDLKEIRIESIQYRELMLENRIKECLLDANPDIVKALAEVGFPGNFSNSVARRIHAVIHEANKALK